VSLFFMKRGTRSVTGERPQRLACPKALFRRKNSLPYWTSALTALLLRSSKATFRAQSGGSSLFLLRYGNSVAVKDP
jgi:hypothetical protein